MCNIYSVCVLIVQHNYEPSLRIWTFWNDINNKRFLSAWRKLSMTLLSLWLWLLGLILGTSLLLTHPGYMLSLPTSIVSSSSLSAELLSSHGLFMTGRGDMDVCPPDDTYYVTQYSDRGQLNKYFRNREQPWEWWGQISYRDFRGNTFLCNPGVDEEVSSHWAKLWVFR